MKQDKNPKVKNPKVVDLDPIAPIDLWKLSWMENIKQGK